MESHKLQSLQQTMTKSHSNTEKDTKMTDFNPEEFLASTVVDDSLDTEHRKCPEGAYRAQIRPVEARHFRNFQSEKTGESYTMFAPLWEILDDSVRMDLEREHVYVESNGMFLDLDETGALDTGRGKNVDLGRLRLAVGQNEKPGWKFTDLNEQIATVRVAHIKDKNSDVTRAKVTRVSAAD